MFNAINTQYAYETSAINDIITAARSGVIHSLLMTPVEIALSLGSISQQLSADLNVPMGTKTSEIFELRKITEMAVYYSKDKLVFITIIPLVVDQELTLYNLLSVPVSMTKEPEKYTIIQPDYPYIAITKDRKHYTTLTNHQLEQCKETTLYRICPMFQPIQENAKDQPCEIELFNQPDSLPSICELRIMRLHRSIYHKLRYQNKWLYSVIDDKVVVSCKDAEEPFITKIKGQGLVEIKNVGCRVYTKDAVLSTVNSMKNTRYIDFIPRINMTVMISKIPSNIRPMELRGWTEAKNIKLTNLHEVSHSLDDIEKMLNVEIERREEKETQQKRFYLIYVTVGIVIVILAMVCMYTMT